MCFDQGYQEQNLIALLTFFCFLILPVQHNTINSVLARGEKLDSLVEKSSDLSMASQACKLTYSSSASTFEHEPLRNLAMHQHNFHFPIP